MRTYHLYQVDAFTTERFCGNPAGVVLNADGLSVEEMQQIARELNNSETAFILSPDGPDHDVWVRFFTPTREVPICGHATISAHFVRALASQAPTSTVVQKTGAGILPVEIIADEGGYRIVMTQGKIEFEPPFAEDMRNAIVAALGLNAQERDARCPLQIVSTGHSKVLIGIREQKILHALKPDFTRLTELSAQIGCNGYFVFTFESESPDILTHGRMFAPAIGIQEDPVTGNANGPLGAYIVRHGLVEHDGRCFCFRGKQGEAIGRPGIVDVTVEIETGQPVKTKVGGQAIVVFQTTLQL